VRHSPDEVRERLAKLEPVDSREYYLRTAPFFETADPRYAWLNTIVTIGNASVVEGDVGPTAVSVTVTLTPASTIPVSVSYATGGGTAAAGTDYTPASGTVDFSIGATTAEVPIDVLGDLLDEPDEGFGVTLSNPVGATRRPRQVTIFDDDPMWTVGADGWCLRGRPGDRADLWRERLRRRLRHGDGTATRRRLRCGSARAFIARSAVDHGADRDRQRPRYRGESHSSCRTLETRAADAVDHGHHPRRRRHGDLRRRLRVGRPVALVRGRAVAL
jgi:hypothetical protein